MTHFDGDVEEMDAPALDDRALDALWSGSRSAPSDLDWLAPFVNGLEEAASTPAPVTRPALALLLSEGFSVETVDVPLPPMRAPLALRKRWSLSRLAAIGLAAKVALGAGVAAAGTTAAAAIGALPAPAQHAVASVVDAATPFTFPDKAHDKSDKASFGATVSADATGATDGVAGVDGKAVSDAAGNKGGNTDPAAGAVGTRAGVGANTGSKGLDRANETPAAGHPSTSEPTGHGTGRPETPGAAASNGLGTANSTPAARKAPTSVPPTPAAAGGHGAPGRNTVSSTPAADRVPARP